MVEMVEMCGLEPLTPYMRNNETGSSDACLIEYRPRVVICFAPLTELDETVRERRGTGAQSNRVTGGTTDETALRSAPALMQVTDDGFHKRTLA